MTVIFVLNLVHTSRTRFLNVPIIGTWRMRALCLYPRLTISSFLIHFPFPSSSLGNIVRPPTRLFGSSLGSSSMNENSQRWEDLYHEGQVPGEDTKNFWEEESKSHPVKVVSFDLDNTIWKTGPTIQAANDALAAYLTAEGINQPERVEHVMGKLFQAEKVKYAPMGGDNPKSPILLTNLRKDAIRFILLSHNQFSTCDANDMTEIAFGVWDTARHEALPKYFATEVLPTLQKIKNIQSSTSRPIFIGAITDGNSDPRRIPEIGSFFDFVVNSENIGVGKPDRRVFLKAVRIVAEHPTAQESIFDDLHLSDNDDNLEDLIGPWWIHIGDDFLKDIVAAKDLGMRCIWAKELIKDHSPPKVRSTNEKSVGEFIEEVSQKMANGAVVKMAIGADDYLADSIRDEFADATVSTFPQIYEVLMKWQENADLKQI